MKGAPLTLFVRLCGRLYELQLNLQITNLCGFYTI